MLGSLEKFNKLVDALEALPTIGKKTAIRVAYHLVMRDNYLGVKIAHAIEDALRNITKCEQCGAMSENELCNICVDDARDATTLCIVQSAKEIILFEENSLFNGKYFVLESVDEDAIHNLQQIVSNGVEEIVFALTPSIQNEAMMLYIEDQLQMYSVTFTKIAQGVPTGVNLENIDILSLTRALQDRVRV